MSNTEIYASYHAVNVKKCFDAFGYKGKTVAECYRALTKMGWYCLYDQFYAMYKGNRGVTLEHVYYMSLLFGKTINELIEFSREGEQDDERTM